MRRALAQEPQDLLEKPRPGGARQRVAAGDDGVVDVGRDAEVEPRAELDGAQDAHRIFAKAHHRIADGVHGAALDVGHAADPVEHFAALES